MEATIRDVEGEDYGYIDVEFDTDSEEYKDLVILADKLGVSIEELLRDSISYYVGNDDIF